MLTYNHVTISASTISFNTREIDTFNDALSIKIQPLLKTVKVSVCGRLLPVGVKKKNPMFCFSLQDVLRSFKSQML